MLTTCALMSVTLLGAASIKPAQVPATHKQVADVRIEQAGMYHISARSDSGTACTLVDHQRGPFANSGTVAKKNCELDLLLDSGTYRLRLESAKEGSGTVQLSVKAFADRFERPLKLERGRSDNTQLPQGQQASWWVRVDARQHVELRVVGRTAGVVKLWRDAKWVEEINTSHSEVKPLKGKPLHAWKLAGTLEAGDYLLTAYGAEAKRWTAGGDQDFVFVANGYPHGPADRVQTFSLPAWGQMFFQVPSGRLAAFLALDGAAKQQVRLEVYPLPDKQGDRSSSRTGSCDVVPKALVPICSAFSNQDQRHLVVVIGPPGTTGRVRWAGYWHSSTLADDLYTSGTTSIEFDAPASGDYLVATDDVPVDTDAAPLSCSLSPVRQVRWKKTQHDYLKLSNDRAFDRAFNYDGREAMIWFEITESGKYRIKTGGERKSRCELFREDSRIERETSGCDIQRSLDRGLYQLKLYRGNPGIERLAIRYGGSSGFLGLGKRKGSQGAKNVTKNSCRIEKMALEKKGRYRLRLNRSGRVTARGLILRKLPLAIDKPLPLVIDAGEILRLPMAAGAALEVRAVGRPNFLCAQGGATPSVARDGVCRLADTGAKTDLVISNPGAESLAVTVLRPSPPVSLAALQVHSPKSRKLEQLKVGQTRFFDFDRGQSHSLVFDVKQAGQYHLTTSGLLATECRVRTPIFPRLASKRGGGRGRNCLVAGYLRPGRYLLTSTTHGQSRGRGGMTVIRRPVEKKAAVQADGKTFFRVAPDTMVQQSLSVPESGRYTLLTQGQGVDLQCRLEDADGWPLVRVPTSCSQSLLLDKGKYLWGQLPLTVESMRQTSLEMVRDAEVLSGNKVHPVKLNKSYTVELGEDGKDTFRFSLSAAMHVYFSLSNSMQARIYRRVKGQKPALVEVIPPPGMSLPEDEAEHEPEDDPGCDCEYVDEYDEECADVCSGSRGAPSTTQPIPAGRRVKLEAGDYELRSEHSRADRGIRYRLSLATTLLAPGLAMEGRRVPGELTVRMPKAGVLRIQSSGKTDVRCRLFDKRGELVSEGSDIGADWNCLTAVPVAAGDYRLVLEAENGIPGVTRVAANAPEVREVGVLSDDQELETSNNVLLGELPKPAGQAVSEVGFSSKLRFSCALEDADGKELTRQMNVLRCGFLVWTAGRAHRVRLWTRRWSGKIKVKMVLRPVVAMSDGDIPVGKAARVPVIRTGRYETAKKVWCIAADDAGPMKFCGPWSSLDKGDVIFSTTGPKREPDLEMEELIAELKPSETMPLRIGTDPTWQHQRSEELALHLLSVSVPRGERAAPACRLEGGVQQLRSDGCYAAVAPTRESLAGWWLAGREGAPALGGGDRSRPANLTRSAARVPKTALRLRPGEHRLVWSGMVARYGLPAGASRIELTLPADAWAVQIGKDDRAVDLCPPEEQLFTCVLGANGGELYLASNADRQARVRVLLVPHPPGRTQLSGLFERWPLASGRIHLDVPAADGQRILQVRGADRCRVALSDGTRLSGCQVELSSGLGAQLTIEHRPGPIQALVSPAAQLVRARWGSVPTANAAKPLLPAEAMPLSGTLVERSLTIDRPSVVRVQAGAGLCGLVEPDAKLLVFGEGLGCDLHRLLQPGAYRLLIRGFAGKPLGGSLVWTSAPLAELSEGVGLEDWVAPGQARTYFFQLADNGGVGIGVRSTADLLTCTVMDRQQRVIAIGCQQFLKLKAGTYLLSVEAPKTARPLRFRPVVLGLSGSAARVPEDYLRSFFQRIGFKPEGGQR